MSWPGARGSIGFSVIPRFGAPTSGGRSDPTIRAAGGAASQVAGRDAWAPRNRLAGSECHDKLTA